MDINQSQSNENPERRDKSNVTVQNKHDLNAQSHLKTSNITLEENVWMPYYSSLKVYYTNDIDKWLKWLLSVCNDHIIIVEPWWCHAIIQTWQEETLRGQLDHISYAHFKGFYVIYTLHTMLSVIWWIVSITKPFSITVQTSTFRLRFMCLFAVKSLLIFIKQIYKNVQIL